MIFFIICNVYITGLTNLKVVSKQSRLSEMGMDSMMGVEIKQTLEREYGIFLTAEDIRNLTFGKLIEMYGSETCNKQVCSNTSGDSNHLNEKNLFFRTIGNFTNLIPEVCVSLSTKNDTSKDEIFLLPGIEGCAGVFSLLAPKIDAPATCLQYGTYNIGNSCDTVADIAEHLLKVE